MVKLLEFILCWATFDFSESCMFKVNIFDLGWFVGFFIHFMLCSFCICCIRRLSDNIVSSDTRANQM